MATDDGRLVFGDGSYPDTYGEKPGDPGYKGHPWGDAGPEDLFKPNHGDSRFGKGGSVSQGGGGYNQGYGVRMRGLGQAELGHAQKLAANENYLGEMKMRQGMAEAQNASMAMAAGRGSSPLGQRSAIYANNQMQSQAVNQGAQLALQEYMARQEMLQGALGRQVGYEQQIQDDASRRYLGDSQYQAQMAGYKNQADIAESDREQQMIGAAIGAAGSLIPG